MVLDVVGDIDVCSERMREGGDAKGDNGDKVTALGMSEWGKLTWADNDSDGPQERQSEVGSGVRMWGCDGIRGVTTAGGDLGSKEVVAAGIPSASSARVLSSAARRHRSPSKWRRRAYGLPFIPSPIHCSHFGHFFSHCAWVPGRIRVGVSVSIEFRFLLAPRFVVSNAPQSLAKDIDGERWGDSIT